MDRKYVAITLVVIIIVASAAGYLAYNGIFSSKTTLRVFIASSLDYVVANMSQAFDKANNCNIVVNSASSSTLYTQIIEGSPCDVFMSANFKWDNQLNSSSNLYGNSYTNFTTNSLIVVLPKSNLDNITSLLDLIHPGVKIVIAEESVPAGEYTNDTLFTIDATWGNASNPLYQGPQWQDYSTKFLANVVSYEDSDESVVGQVSLGLGTADAGVVFVSDSTYGAMTGSQLQYIQIPSAINTQGTYGIAVIKGTSNADLATKFMNYWTSRIGQNLLKTFGFGT